MIKDKQLKERQAVNDLITRQIKTYVPMAVGAGAAYLASKGLALDAETQAGAIIALTGLLQALYYFLVVLISKRYPKAELLLGSTKQPEYGKK